MANTRTEGELFLKHSEVPGHRSSDMKIPGAPTWRPRSLYWGMLGALLVLPAAALADFGPLQLVDNVQVTRVFSGQGTTYVQFTNLPSCIGNGGYLTVSWPVANGAIDENRTKQIVATLLFAKATGTAMEVRYRINTAPTGWDSCAVDAVYLH